MSAPAPRQTEPPAGSLLPVLGWFTAVSLVVGEVIGSGIFIKPNEVARNTGGYVGLILGLWVLCGLVNLCGALTLAELSAMFPHAGGNYVYLREAYGKLWGFLWGWAEFWVIRSGAIAALATAMAMSLAAALDGAAAATLGSSTFEKTVAVSVITLLAAVNIVGTLWGGGVQVLSTLVKVASLLFLAALPLLAAGHEPPAAGPLFPGGAEWARLTGIGAALAGIMWAYDGWGQVTVVAEEIRAPERNVPRALIGGVLVLVVLYLGANLAYHSTLPVATIESAPIPAQLVGETLLPGWGGRLVLAMIVVSTFGALNSNILVGPRVTFAVARDHSFLKWLARIDPRTRTPALSIAAVSLWAVVLVLAGDLSPRPDQRLFDLLTNYAIFGGSLFYFAAVCSVLVLRRRRPEVPRPYRTWGYPWVPLVFIAFYVFFLGTMLYAAWFEALAGLSLIASGWVVYRVLGRLG